MPGRRSLTDPTSPGIAPGCPWCIAPIRSPGSAPCTRSSSRTRRGLGKERREDGEGPGRSATLAN
eukprot:8878660-Pyramimonas_sp.AAC.1